MNILRWWYEHIKDIVDDEYPFAYYYEKYHVIVCTNESIANEIGYSIDTRLQKWTSRYTVCCEEIISGIFVIYIDG